MSHFYALALVHPSAVDDPERALEPMLEPYNENTEVAPYDADCYCVGWNARTEGRDKAVAEVQARTGDTIESLRIAHTVLVKGKELDWDAQSESWQKFTKDYFELREELEKEYTEAHPMHDKPDASCEDCDGTGTRVTQYNPASKWDWWVVGGRWSGHLGGYDVRDYPENFEICFLCNGSGTRPDGIEKFGEDWAKSNNGCNGCNGEGTCLKWGDHVVPSDGNAKPVQSLLSLEGEKFAEIAVPYALVTPKEGWLERGEMGWFGMSSNEKDKSEWADEVRTVLETYSDHIAVVVDCHI